MPTRYHDMPSPAVSPTSIATSFSEIGVNLKVPDGTQASRQRGDIDQVSILALQEKYNRHVIKVIPPRDFEHVVEDIVRTSGVDTLELELSRRMNCVVSSCSRVLEDTKLKIFLDNDVPQELLSFLSPLQQPTFKGWSGYITNSLTGLAELHAASRTTAPVSPSSSTIPNTPNVQQAAKRITQRRSSLQPASKSPLHLGRKAGQIRKARRKPLEQVRRSARLAALQTRENLG